MTLKKILILSLVFVSNMVLVAQHDVCESSSSDDDLLMELNTIDKCLNDQEKAKTPEPKVKTKRYLRTRRSNYYHKLRKNIRSISAAKNAEPKKEVKIKNVYLGEVTEEPTLIIPEGKTRYQGKLRNVLEAYVEDNLEYPQVLEHNGIEGIVWTSFVIDTNGAVKNIVTLGPINGKLLEMEAAKVIKELPKFTPGKIDGELVNVKHLMAIKFEMGK